MSTVTDSLSPLLLELGIYEMSVNQRLALANEIIASVIAEETPPPPLTAAQLQEIERRVAADKANPEDGIPWEVVLQDVRDRLAAKRS